MQDDYRSLHELLQRVQSEQTEQSSIFEDERKKYDNKILDSQARLQQSENKTSEKISEMKLIISKLEQDITALQRELIARTETYVTNLSALSSGVNQIRSSQENQSRNLSSLRNTVSEINGEIQLAGRNLSDPHEMHHDSMHRNTEKLTTIISTLRISLGEHRDTMKSIQLSLEEEKTRTIMLDEERSRLTHDNSSIRERLEEMKRTTSTRVDASRREANAIMTLRDDVERQLQKTMGQLNDANAQTRSLQEQHQILQTTLRDEQSKHSSTMSDLEGHAHKLEIDLKTKTTERDELMMELNTLRRELNETSNDTRDMTDKLNHCEDELQMYKTKLLSNETKNKHQSNSLNDTMNKLQNQLEQTRLLLDTVQQQREMLKNDNSELRNELDTLYKQKTGHNDL